MAKARTTKKQTAARTKRREPTAATLPGTRGEIAEIERLADALLAVRDDTTAAIKEAKAELEEAEEALRASMHRHKRNVYKRQLPDGSMLDVSLTASKEGVRCRRTKVAAKA
ncbi:MAG TPA: hypothetical protein VIY27_10165 [Myxococcota bacterium]